MNYGDNEEGFLYGAAGGAATGFAVGGPIGAGVGAVIGGTLGYLSANKNRKAAKDAQKQAERARANATMREFGLRQQRDSSAMAAAMSNRKGAQEVNSTTGFVGSNLSSKGSGFSGTF